jgi:phosphate uptake regulator
MEQDRRLRHKSTQLQWITDCDLKSEIVKLLQERIGKTIEHISNNFLNRTPITQQIRERIDKQDSIKLKNFYIVKKTVTRLKR